MPLHRDTIDLLTAIRTSHQREDTPHGLLTPQELDQTQPSWHRPQLTNAALAAEGLS